MPSVLIVDDEPNIRRMVGALLAAEGYEVREAPDGARGVALATESEPDIALVDLMMPGMDGYEVCRRLVSDAATKRIPIVLLTARQNLEPDRVRASGARGVITKPFDLDALAPAILELASEQR